MGADSELHDAVTALCRDVNGIDWDAASVQADVHRMLAAVKRASQAALDAALATIVERLRISQLSDADGVAQVAISGGTLVEYGAAPRPLAEVMLSKLPAVLDAARHYADTCLADLPALDEDDEEEEPEGIAHVDERAIPRDVFRSHLETDRGGGCALVGLRNWALPAIAALTRDREMLRRACADAELRARANALRDSDAHWLPVLLGAELDTRWLALVPGEARGFHIRVDGIVSNFDLHTLVAAALIERGVAGKAPPKSLVAFLEGRAKDAAVSHIEGVWNYYDWRAAGYDLTRSVPTERWVWNEGVPSDVPKFQDMRTLLIGPPPLQRTWNVGRTFSALAARVSVEEELPAERVRELLTAMKQEAKRG
ncbi:MAG TPA: hypothetical protein VMZ53_18485 [Kofleriaceae bacterium]|nr:hypothetical protein [Kofleriaceae bacterium]